MPPKCSRRQPFRAPYMRRKTTSTLDCQWSSQNCGPFKYFNNLRKQYFPTCVFSWYTSYKLFYRYGHVSTIGSSSHPISSALEDRTVRNFEPEDQPCSGRINLQVGRALSRQRQYRFLIAIINYTFFAPGRRTDRRIIMQLGRSMRYMMSR